MQAGASIPCLVGFPTTLWTVTSDPPDDQLQPDRDNVVVTGAADSGAPRDAGSQPPVFSIWSPTSWLPRARVRARDGGRPSETLAVGLDEREYRLSVAATVLALGLVGAGYVVNRHSTVVKVRADALTLLVAGLILIAVMAGGVIFRRGSIVGIASFMMGFELISAEDILGALFLIFGGWLIVRSMRRQRAEQAARSRPARKTRATPARPAGRPQPSKRYTPPRRSRISSRRR